MNRLSRICVMACFAATTFLPIAASAQRWVPYNSYRYYMGGGPTQVARRTSLRDQLIRVSERVHRADASRRISHMTAVNYYGRLNRVRDLLRNDRSISASEYDRWRSDLRGIGQDLRRSARR